MKTYSIGIDPDLHTLSFALVSAEERVPKLEGIWTAKAKGSYNEEAVKHILQTAAPVAKQVFAEISPDNRLLNPPYVTIESQNVTYTGRTNAARPQDLITLAQVAGGCFAFFGFGDIVPPAVWKKQMPKKIVQARCLSALGLEYEVMGGQVQKRQYCVPYGDGIFDRTGNLNRGDWKDAGDSVAIAYWRLKKEGLVR